MKDKDDINNVALHIVRILEDNGLNFQDGISILLSIIIKSTLDALHDDETKINKVFEFYICNIKQYMTNEK